MIYAKNITFDYIQQTKKNRLVYEFKNLCTSNELP